MWPCKVCKSVCSSYKTIVLWSDNAELHAYRSFLAHLSQGSFWWAYRISRPPSSITVVVLTLKTSSPQKPLGQSKSNFIWRFYGIGERKFAQMVLVTWPRWPPCPYMIKTLKIFFSGTKGWWPWNLGVHHRVFEYYQVCSNDDPGLTMTYFTARSNLVKKVKQWIIRNYCSLWCQS